MNYKLILFCVTICTQLTLPVLAQNAQPMFQTTFYITDAVGNQDSVIIGFDPTANRLHNPQFGEVHIPEPFDTVLEARACHQDGMSWAPNLVLSKKIIGDAELVNQWGCYMAEQMHIFVKAKHQPVTFRWNPLDWSEFSVCQRYSLMTPDNLIQLTSIEDWYDIGNRRGTCLSDTSDYTLNLHGSAGPEFEFTINLAPNVTGFTDSLFGVLLFWHPFDLPNDFCNETVSAGEQIYQPLQWRVFPNPAIDMVSVRFYGEQTPETIICRDILGQVVSVHQNSNASELLQVATSAWPPGTYTIEGYANGQILGAKKVIVLSSF
jgi:hypothetical protein